MYVNMEKRREKRVCLDLSCRIKDFKKALGIGNIVDFLKRDKTLTASLVNFSSGGMCIKMNRAVFKKKFGSKNYMIR